MIYKIGLSLIPGAGPVIAKRLLAYTGSAEAVFKEKKNLLSKIPNVGNSFIANFNPQIILDQAKKEIEFIERYHINVCFFTDNNYPQRLKNCEDAPVILYSKGLNHIKSSKVLSIVGTRRPTNYGLSVCNEIVCELSKTHKDLIIVSGLAYGIDTCAHKAAINYGLMTIAVLAHGLANIYPASHKSMAEKIIHNGCLFTEFKSTTKAIRGNFISRNRIIAGLADATLVVESAKKGGALITADLANSYHRDVFAIPGRVIDKTSQGCNDLIKTNKAALIESASDLEYVLGWEVNKQKQQVIQKQLFNKLDEIDKKVLQSVKDKEKISIDEICLKMKKPTSQISPVLLNLEFKGLVKCLPGNFYTTKVF